MQHGYRYALTEPAGRNFDPDFGPQLTPAEMLRLGVFGGKYMTDCRKEFPKSWFVGGTIRAAGFSGIAAITEAGVFPAKMRGRSNAGKRSVVTSARSNAIANPATSPAGHGNAKPCCIGLTTVEKFDGNPVRRA
jgi:hypothetical protein